jgi:hypothetical protein
MYSGLISFSETGIVKRGQAEQISKPYLNITRAKDLVTLDFDMYDHKSILIYCKRGKETDFVLLTETTKGPFIDTRPNLTPYSETREYMAVYSEKGEPVGEPDFLQIRTKGKFRLF